MSSIRLIISPKDKSLLANPLFLPSILVQNAMRAGLAYQTPLLQEEKVSEEELRLDLFFEKDFSETEWLDVQAAYERGLAGFFGLSGQKVALGWEEI